MVKTEDILNKLSPDWDGIREITVYGFGRTAVRNVDRLAQGCLPCGWQRISGLP